MSETHDQPLVTVLTAVYNAENFLATTVESILNQTFTNFEYLLINDRSSDNTPSLLAHYAAQDPRIVVLNTPEQLGPSGALNYGLAAARGDLVAILDHDDIAMPERLAKQSTFLQLHPTIGAVGSFPRWIDSEGKPLLTNETVILKDFFPITPATSRWALHFRPALPHCSLMVRREAMNRVNGYSLRYRYICDYDLQIRLSEHIDMVNIPEILAEYRVHSGQTSEIHRIEQSGMYFLRIAAVLRKQLRQPIAIDEVVAYYHSFGGIAVTDSALISRVAALLERVYQNFVTKEVLTPTEFAWISHHQALCLASFADVHKTVFPEHCAPLFKRADELKLIAMAIAV
jgi:glycosyltransferase involved in cell wall biosynthesis